MNLGIFLHVQYTRTFHPGFFNFFAATVLRLTFLDILSLQNSILLVGNLLLLHPLCPCQKHPLIKTATFDSGKMTSGVPGNLEKWLR